MLQQRKRHTFRAWSKITLKIKKARDRLLKADQLWCRHSLQRGLRALRLNTGHTPPKTLIATVLPPSLPQQSLTTNILPGIPQPLEQRRGDYSKLAATPELALTALAATSHEQSAISFAPERRQSISVGMSRRRSLVPEDGSLPPALEHITKSRKRSSVDMMHMNEIRRSSLQVNENEEKNTDQVDEYESNQDLESSDDSGDEQVHLPIIMLYLRRWQRFIDWRATMREHALVRWFRRGEAQALHALRSFAQDRKKMRKLLQCMHQAKLFSALRKLRWYKSKRQQSRRKLVAVMRHWRGTKIHSAIVYWRYLTHTKKFDKNALEKADRHYEKSMIPQAWSRWREIAISRSRLRRVIERWNNLKMIQALSEWRSWNAKQASSKALLRKYVNRIRMQSTLRAFTAWTNHIMHVKQLRSNLAKTIGIWQGHTTGKILNAWKKWYQMKVAMRKKTREGKYHIEQLKLRRSLLQWRQECYKKNVVENVAESVIRIWRNRDLYHAIHVWRDWTHERSREKKIMVKTLRRLQKASAFAAIKLWREKTAINKKRRQVIQKVFITWQNRKLVSALRMLHEYPSTRKVLRAMECKADQLSHKFAKKNAIHHWRALNANKKLIQRCVVRWKCRGATQALQALKRYRENRIIARSRIAHAVRCHYNILSSQFFRKWRVFVRLYQCERINVDKAVVTWLQKNAAWKKKQVFHVWIMYIRNKEKKRDSMDRAGGFYKKTLFRKIFCHWSRFCGDRVELRNKECSAAVAVNTLLLWRGLLSLKKHMVESRRFRELSRGAIVRWKHCQQLWALKRLSEHYILRRDWRKRAKRALSFWINSALRTAFDSFTQATRVSKCYFEEQVLAFRRKKLAKRVWIKLKLGLLQRQERMQMLARTIQMWTSSSLVRVFTKWKEATKQRKEIRKLSHQWLYHKVAKALSTLQYHASSKRKIRESLQRTIHLWQNNRLITAMNCLQSFAYENKKRRKLNAIGLSHARKSKLGKVWSMYLLFVEKSKIKKDNIMTARQFCCQRIMGIALNTWKKSLIQGKHRNNQLLRVCSSILYQEKLIALKLWRERTSVAHKTRRLLYEAKLHWCRHIALIGLQKWRTWSNESQKTKTIRNRAINLWIHKVFFLYIFLFFIIIINFFLFFPKLIRILLFH